MSEPPDELAVVPPPAALTARWPGYASPAVNPLLVYLAARPRSRASLRSAAARVARELAPGASAAALPWHALTYAHTAALRARLALACAPAYATLCVTVLRGVLKECWRLGHMSREAYARAADVPRVKGARLPAGQLVTRAELAALFRACAGPADRAARDAAWLAVLCAGLRAAETCALRVADYDRAAGRLRVRGKGNKEREAWLPDGSMRALARWLDRRGGGPTAPIFVPCHRTGVRSAAAGAGEQPMATAACRAMLRRLARATGGPRHTPHDARRTYITGLLASGADLLSVMKLVGHESSDTTSRYDRRPAEAAAKVARAYDVPTEGEA